MKYLIIGFLGLFMACNGQETKKTVSKKQTTQQTKTPQKMKTIYNYTFKDINDEDFSFADLKGKKILILNTASKCGYTPQYDALEKLYQEYKDQNFVIIGFPSDNFGGQEFDNNEEIATFCKLNYGVTFPLMSKSDVIGNNQNEVFKFLTKKAINGKSDNDVKWNFTKFLINEDGTLEASYPSKVTPDSKEIIDWLNK
ncbi:glutathione peroxidase [Chishuiella changwenlii]|jgi:glutathione peroxidase|uniref:Glutathione peroxidase n=1 Tax=Chishuiella changwenlii TaxID=1434701 RepID=A0A1M6VR91_9FLAO|nr:glutathione peroxidase [Chishuiella changwenlii]GGF11183.1 glutathione peroxidase [Chishuiella changwenlii]SHK83979.1 glutathione peroxidase [Chishuiella changwenlii]